jgi:hypothetical protein
VKPIETIAGDGFRSRSTHPTTLEYWPAGFGFASAIRASIIGTVLTISALGSLYARTDYQVSLVTPAADVGDYFANWRAERELSSDCIPAGERADRCEAFQHRRLRDHPDDRRRDWVGSFDIQSTLSEVL